MRTPSPLALAALAALLLHTSALVQLEPLNIDPESVTASGISAGAAMATQLHVALSATVQGAALFAGVPFHCAQGLLAEALTCMSTPGLVPLATLISETDAMESRGSIDATANLADDRAYVFAGTLDTVVNPAAGQKAQDFYENYGTAVVSEYSVAAEHCQPTDDYGPACSYLGDEYINNCDYNGAYEALSVLYGGLARPDGTEELPGTFDEFDQSLFISGAPSGISMDDVGYVYIPSACQNGTTVCKLHIALHGCLQGREVIGDAYARSGEYLSVAELNNIVVLFPQAVKTALSNPNGCWDWWGYTGIGYSGRDAPQIVAIKGMIDLLVDGDGGDVACPRG